MSDEAYLSAANAADLLGVKRETLYAYVSRGWLTSVPDPGSKRARLYRRAEVDRLRSRAQARSGEGPVAAAALRWGAPVLETSICRITEHGPEYRGHALAELVDEPFERVAELLWSGDLGEAEWSSAPIEDVGGALPLDRMRRAVLAMELADPARDVGGPAASRQAEQIVCGMVAALRGADREGSIARRLTAALGGSSKAAEAVRVALVVCAEHELNASAFAARVAASTGANLYACVTAALATFVGPRHGGVSRRIDRLIVEARKTGARRALLDRLTAGESVPGFSHPLYPHGDPRFDFLWAAAECTNSKALAELRALIDSADELGLGRPDLDVGLTAIVLAGGLRDGSEAAIFALGRTAGWIAHAREQATQGFMLRPRAHYVGSGPE